MTFKEEFWAEWARLNPVFCRDEDNILVRFLRGFHEGWYGYFAPLRILWWLVKAAKKRVMS